MSLLCHLFCGLHRTNANVNIPTMVMDLAEQETVCMDPKVVFASLLALIESEKDEEFMLALAAPFATLKVIRCL